MQNFFRTLLFLIFHNMFLIHTGYGQINLDADTQKKQIEMYFENLKSIESNFIQYNQDGSVYKGRFYLLRPNKFRLDYEIPSTLLVLSDGKSLINFDQDAGDASYLSLDSTPAHFILRDQVKLEGDVTLSSLMPGENILRATLVKTKDTQMGSLTLVFQQQPFMLKGWVVLDSQGTLTQVILSDVQEGVELDLNLFEWKKR